MKAISYLFLFIVTTIFLTGCGFKDIDKRLFVVSIGIDPAKNSEKKFLISLKFAIPITKEESNEFLIVSEEADSISEAVRIIKTKVDKEIDFSHSKVIIYNQEIVERNFEPNLYYWFIRRRDIQAVSWVAIGKPTALEVLKLKPKTEHLPSNALFLALGKDGSETAYIISEFLFDFKKRFNEKGLDPLLPIIEAGKGLFEINKVALLDKHRLKTVLKPEETKMLNYLLNDVRKSALKIQDGNKAFIIDASEVKTKYKIISKNQMQPYIKVDVLVKSRIEEALFSVKNKDLAKYEEMANKVISKELHQVLVKIQKANVDPIGFGLLYRSRHFEKDDWETWQHIYPTIKFKVNTKVLIEDTGLVE
jgi:spore germination protein KC